MLRLTCIGSLFFLSLVREGEIFDKSEAGSLLEKIYKDKEAACFRKSGFFMFLEDGL